jgi:hypothetical protein
MMRTRRDWKTFLIEEIARSTVLAIILSAISGCDSSPWALLWTLPNVGA